jgi:hypothetical protein
MPRLLHHSLNRARFKDEIMQQFKVLQRPLRVCRAALSSQEKGGRRRPPRIRMA